MNNSRTKNTLKNFTISFGVQILTLIVTFINRTIFIRVLNADYLGINGLFSNVLTVLSFAELGIGSAIIYSMYKPAKENDYKTIGGLLNLYRKAYGIIAIIIAGVGVVLIPVLGLLIKEPPAIQESIVVIYVLFLANTVSSYILSYRKSLFTVYQKEYINVLIERFTHIICVIAQLLYLFITHNYIGFLVIQIISTLVSNVIIYIWAGKQYAEIIEYSNEKLDKKVVSSIFDNIKAIFCYKIGSVILNATDNIIITRIISVSIVGICSNYTLLISTLESILSRALNSIVASIGNLNASNGKERKIEVFGELNLCVYWLYGFCSIELLLMLNKVVLLWLGEKYVISDFWSIIALVLNFYIFGTNFVPSNYRVTMGYFREARITPIIASVINIVLSVYLGKRFGLFGIYIATSIARITTFGIIDPITVFKKGFGISTKIFYLKQIAFFVITIVNASVCNLVIQRIALHGIVGMLIDCCIIAVISNAIYLVVLFWTKDFKALSKRIVSLIRRRL